MNHLFLNVQLHKGHVKMVREAAQAVSPLSNGDGMAGAELGLALKSGPAPFPAGKTPLLFDDLLFVSHSPAPTGLPLTSFHHGLNNHYISLLTLKIVHRAPLLLGNVLRGRTAQLNPLSCGCPRSGGAGFQLPVSSGWMEAGWHFPLALPKQGLPLVFLSTHKSLLDGILLPFVLLSQGLGVLRVAWDPCVCSPILR